jgi:hypothetical protein
LALMKMTGSFETAMRKKHIACSTSENFTRPRSTVGVCAWMWSWEDVEGRGEERASRGSSGKVVNWTGLLDAKKRRMAVQGMQSAQ